MQDRPRPARRRLRYAGQRTRQAFGQFRALPHDLRTSLLQLSLALAGTPILLLFALAWAPVSHDALLPEARPGRIVLTQPLPPAPASDDALTHALRAQAETLRQAPAVTEAIVASLPPSALPDSPETRPESLRAALMPAVLPPRLLDPPPLPATRHFRSPPAWQQTPTAHQVAGWTQRLSFPGPTGRQPPAAPPLPVGKPPDGRLLPLQDAAVQTADLPAAHSLAIARRTRRALRQAEADHALPDGLLQALALVESGTNVAGERHPWPWSLNSNGHGWRFASRTEALEGLERLLLAGYASVDLGALQVNLFWHGEDVGEFAHGLDPEGNARISARFLKELQRQFGSWEAAVRHYHSYNPVHQQRYLCRVSRELRGLGRDPGQLFGPDSCG
ncbi:hypothetical protein [Fodinicurvata sediminis]|uniref:hypothetical protein n=1 Tax=Fodinicurvata sediminis TaxID=1121832 RepID=UPI0003B5509F|nr:hypothetical protein [Fodinicurvata sediminis]